MVRLARDDLKDFQMAQHISRRSQGSNEERRKLKWKKLRENFVKANWDGCGPKREEGGDRSSYQR